MSKLRRHITYANVTSTLALFIALGGTSFAVTERTARDAQNTAVCCDVDGDTATLRLNAVRTGNIANGQVTTADLGTGAVISTDVRDGALGGPDLRDGSIGVADLSPAVVARLKKAPAPDGDNGDDENGDDDDDDNDNDDNDNDTPTTGSGGPVAP